MTSPQIKEMMRRLGLECVRFLTFAGMYQFWARKSEEGRASS
jgi:hypothetical protein